jgi:signal transduction histidine kinase
VILEPPEPALVPVDPQRFRQILGHLVRNGIVHGGSDVVVRVAPTPTGVRLSVRDFGPGIPESSREPALEPFVRLDREGHGTGLGLTVAHRLVVAMGGDLTIATPADGPGTEVRVELPASPRLDAYT